MSRTNYNIYNNVAFIYAPKGKNPYTGVWDNSYFVPAEICSRGEPGSNNYIVVTCTPSLNGMWAYPAELAKNYDKWANGKLTCLYVPVAVCKKVATLEQCPEVIKNLAKKQQEEWFNSEVKNNPKSYKKKPDWMLF